METSHTTENREGVGSAKYIAWILAIYVLFRLPILFSNADSISFEYYRGTIANELLIGMNLPWWDYLTDSYALAPFFNGILTVPLFLLFGKTLLALKLLPFFWYIISLIAWFFLWRSYFGPRQAFLILLLFVLAPQRITAYTFSNHGTHFELILWTALSLLILKKIYDGGWTWGWGGFWLGLLGGFSSSLILTNGVTVAMILAYVFLSRGHWKFYLTYLPGFLIGFSPLLFFNATHHWGGADFVREMFFYSFTWGDLLEHFREIYLRGDSGFRGLFCFYGLRQPFNRVLTNLYVGIYLLSFAGLFIRRWGFWKNLKGRLDIEAFAILYQIFLLFLVWIVQFGWSINYLFPLVPFVGMTLVSGLQRLSPVLKRICIGYCLAAGILGNLLLIHWGEMGRTRFMKGYSYGDLAEVMEVRFGNRFDLFREKVSRAVQNRSPEIQRAFYHSLSENFFALNDPKEIGEKLNFIRGVGKEFQSSLFEKLGTQLMVFAKFDLKNLEHALKVNDVPLEYHPEIYRGVVLGLNKTEENIFVTIGKALRICKGVVKPAKPACYEATGELLDAAFWPEKRAVYPQAVVSRMEGGYEEFYFRGLGRYFAPSWIEDPQTVSGVVLRLAAAEKNWFYQGIAKEISLLEDPWTRQALMKKLPKHK